MGGRFIYAPIRTCLSISIAHKNGHWSFAMREWNGKMFVSSVLLYQIYVWWPKPQTGSVRRLFRGKSWMENILFCCWLWSLWMALNVDKSFPLIRMPPWFLQHWFWKLFCFKLLLAHSDDNRVLVVVVVVVAYTSSFTICWMGSISAMTLNLSRLIHSILFDCMFKHTTIVYT